ncbi:HprK-related kinase B [Pseudodesulfovibrio aespoeensis]|uniref:HprK-related kinase B n=1 Tax=Pseudodesulfovibrio aespoeensis TaxID=182210 RepID=UPI002353C6C7|nr:HprK-related kinase B [Pseudodesulfovibrio aespoeensis]MCG2734720.1 HprK-related kinase B [Pseudodesulfovibrio aespoeensis]
MMLTDVTSCKELVARFRESVPADKGLLLDFGGCVVQALCSTDTLRDELAAYFKEFVTPSGSPDIVVSAHEADPPETGLDFSVKQPDSGKTKIKEEWADLEDGRVVRKRLTGMHFVFGQGENATIGPCLANSNQVINFINNRFIEWKLNLGGLLGHAAGVAHHGRGISLAGFSGAGKSTLALHLMSRGTTFISNDRVMVEQNGNGLTMFGVAKQPRINPGTALHNPDLCNIVEPDMRRDFLAMPPEELWRLEHKYDALIDECYGPGRFMLRHTMNALVILNWTRGGGSMKVSMVDPLERADLLAAFMRDTGLFYLPADPERAKGPDVGDYARMLGRADLIEISGGIDFEGASTVCLHYMATGELPENQL